MGWTRPRADEIKMDAEIGSYQGEEWEEIVKPADRRAPVAESEAASNAPAGA